MTTVPGKTIWNLPPLRRSSSKNLVEEDTIVREIQSLWTGPSDDVRTILVKEMVASVVKLHEPDADALDLKILH